MRVLKRNRSTEVSVRSKGVMVECSILGTKREIISCSLALAISLRRSGLHFTSSVAGGIRRAMVHRFRCPLIRNVGVPSSFGLLATRTKKGLVDSPGGRLVEETACREPSRVFHRCGCGCPDKMFVGYCVFVGSDRNKCFKDRSPVFRSA